MKRKVVKVILALILAIPALAEEKVVVTEQNQSDLTKNLMNQLLNELLLLKQYFSSSQKFNDPKNQKSIEEHLTKFAKLAKLAKHDPVLNQDNFKFSGQVLEESISEIANVYRTGNKDYARWQLGSVISVCMSCHTQMPAANKSFDGFKNLEIFVSEFDRADFLFATRDFESAFKIYEKMIMGYPANGYGPGQIETALSRQLTYFTRLKRKFAEGKAAMKGYQKNNKLPVYLQKNIAAWISQLQRWENIKLPNPQRADGKEVVLFAQKNIEAKWTSTDIEASNPNLVTYLAVSSVLYEYLQLNPKSETVPEILYWLAVCDRSINYMFFYSLASLYLRECIERSNGNPIANKCFQEYEDEVISGYSGSGGTNVPSEINDYLNSLKQSIKNKKRLEVKKP
jgi:hypothetical protein